MKLTNYFIKKKIQALEEQAAHREHHSLSLAEARSLLVFYNIEDHQAVTKLLTALHKENKKISTCVFVPEKNNELQESDTTIFVHAKRDLNAWCFPSEKIVERVKATQADILIDLTRPNCYAMHLIILQHPCSFKVGIKYPEQEWYDFALSITDKDDLEYLFGQILFYLRSIGTK